MSPGRTCTGTPRLRRTPSCTRSTCWSTGPRSMVCRQPRSTRGSTCRGTTSGRQSAGRSRSRCRSPRSCCGEVEMRTKTNIPNPTGYAGIVTKAPRWYTLVVLDTLVNNLTSGLFLVVAVGELAAPATFMSVATWAYPVALALLLADFACLVLDLGDPLRFHHMLRVFKPSSPMSLGTWCLTVYSQFLTVLVALELAVAVGWLPSASGLAWWARKLAVAGGLPFAF